MGDALVTPEGIRAGYYCGPAAEGPDRLRVQIETDGIVVLTRPDVFTLMAALHKALWEIMPPAVTVPNDQGGTDAR